ncbi:MAG: hypothetical protein ACRD44_02140 [Bryobacteraceae bacterium]
MRITSVLLLLFVAAAMAQETRISGPVSAWVFDHSERSLRPIIGSPGSAYLGPAAVTELDFASIAPDGRSALAVRSGTLWLGALIDGGWAWGSLRDQGASSIAWDRSAGAAVVYETAPRRLTLFRGLDAEAKSEPLAALPEGELTALAVDSDAVLAAVGDAVYRIDAASAKLLANVEKVSAIVLRGGDLYAADRARGEIARLRNYREPSGLERVAAVEAPVAMSLGADGATLLVAGAGKLVTLDAASGTVTREWITPAVVDRLEMAGELHLLNARLRAEDVLHVLDNGSVWFVPAGRVTLSEPSDK